jgi:hypothetical protein
MYVGRTVPVSALPCNGLKKLLGGRPNLAPNSCIEEYLVVALDKIIVIPLFDIRQVDNQYRFFAIQGRGDPVSGHEMYVLIKLDLWLWVFFQDSWPEARTILNLRRVNLGFYRVFILGVSDKLNGDQISLRAD